VLLHSQQSKPASVPTQATCENQFVFLKTYCEGYTFFRNECIPLPKENIYHLFIEAGKTKMKQFAEIMKQVE
jgi:hypothetical protein